LRRYEILFIAHVDLSDDALNETIERYKTIIIQSKGVVVKIDKWGTRKLAYEIKKQKKGTYVLIDFAGQSTIVSELERMFKIEDNILKFLTVMKEDKVNLLDLEKEKQAEISAEAKTTAPEGNGPTTSVEAAEDLPVNQETSEDMKGEKD
jgi:small subunit ribosomal protein S6